MAGLFSAEGDAVVSVDADLRDDLEAIERTLDHVHGDSEIVYGVRKRRDIDGFASASPPRASTC